jgi:glycosyltransferase involved in cell wall biosynthesis
MAPLIFATRRPPYPLDNGARIRTLRLAQGLAQRFDLVLVTFADGPAYDATTATRAELERALPDGRVELVPYGRRPPGGARRNLLRRASDTFGHYATRSLREALERLLADRPDAVLHLDDPGVALAGVALPAGLRVMAPHNVEHRIIRDIGRRMPPAHRPGMAVEWRKIAAEERRCWRRADLCVAVSEVDAATMRAAGAGAVEVCPNGSDPHDALAPVALAADGVLRLLFVGSLRFWPYAHAMSWFVREVLPALRAAAGPVVLDVVGEHEEDVVADPDVRYHGRVESVVPFYARAHALVLPVFEGSGTRLKVVEAALLGRPIVSTALGVEGLPLAEDVAYLRAEDAAGFAAAAARLRAELGSADPALAARCAHARAAVADLTWPRIAARLADLYEERLITRSGPRRSPPPPTR